MKIIVHVSRLDSGVFSGREGDIAAAYSAPVLSGGEKGGIRTFHHEGKLWTTGGHFGSFFHEAADAHELIPIHRYTGPDSAPYSYEGKTVTWKKQPFRLGPKTQFIAADRTVAEWCNHLRQTYEVGGHFTSGRTYHELLREFLEKEIWDVPSRSYVPPSGNVIVAINLELTKPDFDKALPRPVEQPVAICTA